LTRNLDPKLRKESLETLIVDYIRAAAVETPLLIVFEDRHWIDPLSADLLAQIERRTEDLPVLILEIYRLPEDTPGVVEIPHPPRFREIRLVEFTDDEAGLLILSKLARLYGAQSSVSESLVARIAGQAQGNPFYIDEIINYLYARGLELSDLYTLENFDLPASLHSLILSRIDQLTESAKTTLKVASVVGRTFKAPWLWGIYPKLGTPERVLEQLDELRKLDIAPVESPDSEQEYFFRHILTRDVSYESLALETRTRLHELIGRYIETRHSERIPQFLDLLAYHYGMSENVNKQRKYFLEAGEAAQKRYDNRVALQYYRRLLPLLDEPEQPAILLRISQVLQLTGKWDEAEQTARRALSIAGQHRDPHTEAQARHRLGAVLRLQGRFDEAQESLTAARRAFDALDDLSGVNECLNNLGLIAWNQGNFDGALTLFQEMERNAQKIGSSHDAYRATGNAGLVYWYQGDLDKALTSLEKARKIAADIPDQMGDVRIAGNMGNIYLDLGDYRQAFAAYMTYLKTSAELGYREGISIASGNLGTVYAEQGEYENALICFTFNLKIAHEMGDPIGVAMSFWYLGLTFVYLQQLGRARLMLDKSIEIAREVDIPYELSDFLYANADRLTRQRDYAAALKNAQEAMELAREVENDATAFQSQVLTLHLSFYLGTSSLDAAIDQLANLLREYTGEKEQAALHYAIWQLDDSQAGHRDESASLYRQLYEKIPNIQYKRRYERLTGETLPDPSPLPPLPAIIADANIALDRLLEKI